MLSKHSWLFFLTSKHCQEGLKVQQHRPTKHSPCPLLVLGKQSSALMFCAFLQSFIPTGKVASAEAMLTPTSRHPQPGRRSQSGDTQSEGGGALSPRHSVIVFFAKGKKIAMQSPQLAFLRNSAWCDRPASSEPVPRISQAGRRGEQQGQRSGQDFSASALWTLERGTSLVWGLSCAF